MAVRLCFIGFVCLALLACPPTMEPTFNNLLLKNSSDMKIKTLLNISYPDSSLTKAFPDRYLNPNSQGYVGNIYNLENLSGLTLFIFEHGYFWSQERKNGETPDQYLDVNKILRRYVLSKAELDSLSWTLVFP